MRLATGVLERNFASSFFRKVQLTAGVMRGCSRAIVPGIPFASISVSFVALRILSWAEPLLLGKPRESSTFSLSYINPTQHFYRASNAVRLPLWAFAVPLDLPVTQHRLPRMMSGILESSKDNAVPSISGGFPVFMLHMRCMYRELCVAAVERI